MKIGSVLRKGLARISNYTRSGTRGGAGALILGQRPTSPKGAQCYVGPLAHCGSHCCANCITTGSGRDLPSVSRNSVSRGLAPALHNATATAPPATHRRQTSPATAARGCRNVRRITAGRYTSVSVPRAALRNARLSTCAAPARGN